MKRVISISLWTIILHILTGCLYDAIGQVKTYDKVFSMGKLVFNYPQGEQTDVRKKNKTVRIVYSDRENNMAYEDPYLQRKATVQKMGEAFYMIDYENQAYELVPANKALLGKPKALFGFLYSGKNHFKSAGSSPYIGWMVEENLLMYDHAFVSKINHRPIKYRVGISELSRLYDLQPYFRKDTLLVFQTPHFKERTPKGVLSGQIVYAYKYDHSERAVLISDKPTLADKARTVLGWVPADLIAEVGQNYVFRVNTHVAATDTFSATRLYTNDTLFVRADNLQSEWLFDQDGNPQQPDSYADLHTSVNMPIAVWGNSHKSLKNIKGVDLMVGDIDRMERENKQYNIHLLFFYDNKRDMGRFINTVQNLRSKLSPTKTYAFSTTCIFSNGIVHVPTTADFAAWVKNTSWMMNMDSVLNRGKLSGLDGAIRKILEETVYNKYDNNIFLIFGDKQPLTISSSLMDRLVRQFGHLLFVQIEAANDQAHHNFTTNALGLLEEYDKKFSAYISNYIVDSKLQKPIGILQSVDANEAKMRYFDAPAQTLSTSSSVFSSVDKPLLNVAVDLAIDTLLSQTYAVNDLLIHSLRMEAANSGALWGSLSAEVDTLLNRRNNKDTLVVDEITRNSVYDALYRKYDIPTSQLRRYHIGYLFSATELNDLIQSYHALLPTIAGGLTMENMRFLRKIYKRTRKDINHNYGRKVMPSNQIHLSHVYYYRTGIPVYNEALYSIDIDNVDKQRTFSQGFSDVYMDLVKKLDELEKKFASNELEEVDGLSTEKYYFVPSILLP